jgi:C4-dicarboxylate-specific signal transduction histidine kinase
MHNRTYAVVKVDRSGISTWFNSDNRLVGVDEQKVILIYRNSSI